MTICGATPGHPKKCMCQHDQLELTLEAMQLSTVYTKFQSTQSYTNGPHLQARLLSMDLGPVMYIHGNYHKINNNKHQQHQTQAPCLQSRNDVIDGLPCTW